MKSLGFCLEGLIKQGIQSKVFISALEEFVLHLFRRAHLGENSNSACNYIYKQIFHNELLFACLVNYPLLLNCRISGKNLAVYDKLELVISILN